MFIGALEIVAGVPAALYLFWKAINVTIFKTSSVIRVESHAGMLLLLVTLVFVATAAAGWRLWKGDKLGYHLSAGLLALQAIRVVVPGFQFEIYCPISLGLGWVTDGPSEGLAFVTGYGLNFWLAWMPTVPEPCVSVNAIALVAVLYLLVAVRRPAVVAEVAAPVTPA